MELDLRDYIKVIRKRLLMITLIVVVITVATGAISFFALTPIYQASTKLIVNKPTDTVALQQLNTDIINTNLRLIDTYKEIIKTPAIMDAVVQQYPELNISAEDLIKKVSVSSVNNTQVMTLSVQDPSYAAATRIVNAVSKVFQQEIPKIMQVDNVSLLNEAKLLENPVPIKPNKVLNTAIAFVVSLMLSLGLVFLLEFLDDTVKTEADVRELLGVPMLTAITKIKDDDLKEFKADKKQVGDARHATTTINN